LQVYQNFNFLNGKKSMRPLTAVTLILLGSSFAITFSLAAVTIVFLVLGDEYPRLQYEFDSLLSSLGIFTVMTVIAAASFYTLVKDHPARFWMQAVLWLGVLATGGYYWPT
jgi:hypothetical protein